MLIPNRTVFALKPRVATYEERRIRGGGRDNYPRFTPLTIGVKVWLQHVIEIAPPSEPLKKEYLVRYALPIDFTPMTLRERLVDFVRRALR